MPAPATIPAIPKAPPLPTYTQTIRVKNAEELASVRWVPGLQILASPGLYQMWSSLNPVSDTRFAALDPAHPPVIACPKLDAINVNQYMARVRVEDIICQTDRVGTEMSAGVRCGGTDCFIRNIEQIGGGRVLQFDKSVNLIADVVKHINGKLAGSAIYCGEGMPGSRMVTNANITNIELVIPNGTGATHGVRCHFYDGVHLGIKSILYLAKHDGTAVGAAITFKEGRNASATGGVCNGPIGCGPLAVHRETKRPGWESERCEKPAFIGMEINTPQYVSFGAGCVNVLLKDCHIAATDWDFKTIKGACLNLEGPAGAWPLTSGEAVNCEFKGKVYTGNASGWVINGKAA